MRKKKILNRIKNLKDFFWLVFLIIISILATKFYEQDKKNQSFYLKKTLNNTYLQSSIKKLTDELSSRYDYINYTIKEGDTFESIFKKLKLPKKEKKIFLDSVGKEKQLKVLKLNQNINFKIDKKDSVIILEFKVELDNKNEIIFFRSADKKNSFQKQLKNI